MKIMLDAGHYGDYQNMSPCNTNPRYYESTMTWKLHLRLKMALEKLGFEVGVTRKKKDQDLPVYDRGQMAAGYDLFLSLHSNACAPADGSFSPNEDVDRPVIIWPFLGGTEQKKIAEALGNTVRSVMETKQAHQLFQLEYPGRPGVDYYGVIRGAVEAGCKNAFIVEHSFHTCTRSTEWLLRDANLQKLAEAEAATLAKLFKTELPVPDAPEDPEPQKIYTVQVGSFNNLVYAEAFKDKLIAEGYKGAFITEKKK